MRQSSNYRTSPPERVAWPINDGAFRLGVSEGDDLQTRRDGKIRLIKVGGRRLIPDAEITRLASGAGA